MTEKEKEGYRRRQARYMERLKAAAAELPLVKKQLAELQAKEAKFVSYEAEITRLKADNAFLRQKSKLISAVKEFFGLAGSGGVRFMLLCMLVAFLLGGLVCLTVLIGIGQVKPIF